MAGGFNTIAGYLVGLGVYHAIGMKTHILIVGIVSSFLAITVSFLTYKLWVFRTKKNWLGEYLKSFIVYGFSAFLGILLLWALVDGALIPFWLAQAVAITVLAVFSYYANCRFTFRETDG